MAAQASVNPLIIIRDIFQAFWQWQIRFFLSLLGIGAYRKKKPLRGNPMPLIIPSDDASARYGDTRRSNNLMLAGQNLTINTAKRASGNLFVMEDEVSEEEMENARNQMRKIAQRLASTLSRNRRHSKTRLQIDFRRSMRHSIQTGGVMIDLKYRTRILKKQQLVIILDTSGSMQVWIKMLVQMVQAIGLELSKKELFIFAHDLELVTKDLKKTWQETIEALKQRENWGGTTNIDIALKNLQKNHHDKFGPQSIVLMLSDLFTAEPEKAADEVRKITRRTKRFFIFRAVDDEIAREEYNTYFETYVRPFIGTASAIFDINSIDSMAHAVRNVCIRH
jgi:hypothetical protein